MESKIMLQELNLLKFYKNILVTIPWKNEITDFENKLTYSI